MVKERPPYRVLARKYRPARFEELVGQDVMVRTLKGAFEGGRIAQAFMLTGLRGIGKTTTARILARALNYEPKAENKAQEEASAGPTINLTDEGRHCAAIIAGEHLDVLELDAASHTGIKDIREIIDAARYKPVTARYKVFIIDEIHMLSKQAFNGLLKTLEEPPEHVKFIFATTEVNRVPATVLSRCQRFSLMRIKSVTLVEAMKKIAEAEKVKVEEAALRVIARAAEGSMRDALSLLDQAMALASGTVRAEEVRDMLGLATRIDVGNLFEMLTQGRVSEALSMLDRLYDRGVDPANLFIELADFCHLVTRLIVVPEAETLDRHSDEEIALASALAKRLKAGVLTRLWQLLNRGQEDIAMANRPYVAAEMVAIRLCYAASLPDPAYLIKQMRDSPAHDHAAVRDETQATKGGASRSSSDLAASDRQAPLPSASTASGPVLQGHTAKRADETQKTDSRKTRKSESKSDAGQTKPDGARGVELVQRYFPGAEMITRGDKGGGQGGS